MLFFDSYALIEIIRGSSAYRSYRHSDGVTSKLNLLEVYYVLLQDRDLGTADRILREKLEGAVDFPDWAIPLAAQLRLARLGATGRRLSYIDALGYVYARGTGFKFLTGAHEFEGWPGVEFVR